jgi:hypothetical protein
MATPAVNASTAPVNTTMNGELRFMNGVLGNE